MSTKISVLDESTPTNLTAGGTLPATKSVDRALTASPLGVVRIFYTKPAGSTVNLKCTVSLKDAGTLPSSIVSVTDADYVAYTLTGTTGQLNSLSVATPLTSFSSIDEGDIIGLSIERKGTDTGDFYVVKVEFEFNKDAGSGATAQLYDIVTLAEVKEFLAMSGTDQDSFLQRWISYVSLAMEGPDAIDSKIKGQIVTNEIGNGNGRTKFRPRNFPVIGIGASGATDAEILASMQYSNDGTWTNLCADVDDFVLNNPPLSRASEQNSYNIELLKGMFPTGNQNILLNPYRAGYSVVPVDLVIVCCEKVLDIYLKSNRGGSRFGISSRSNAEIGSSWNTTFIDFSDRHRKMMRPYKRPY